MWGLWVRSSVGRWGGCGAQASEARLCSLVAGVCTSEKSLVSSQHVGHGVSQNRLLAKAQTDFGSPALPGPLTSRGYTARSAPGLMSAGTKAVCAEQGAVCRGRWVTGGSRRLFMVPLVFLS